MPTLYHIYDTLVTKSLVNTGIYSEKAAEPMAPYTDGAVGNIHESLNKEWFPRKIAWKNDDK